VIQDGNVHFFIGFVIGLLACALIVSVAPVPDPEVTVQELVKAGHAEYYLDYTTDPPERKWRLINLEPKTTGSAF
jgi:hypothetical protein